MTDPASKALRQLRGGLAPVLDESAEQARRERIAARVLELSRELTARQQRRRRFAWGVAVAALVGGACALLLWFTPAFDPANLAAGASEVRLVAGQLSVRDGAAFEQLAPGEHALGAEALLVTPERESAELLLKSDTALSLAPASQVGLSRKRPARDVFEERVRLRAGAVALRVPKLGGRGTVSVETSDALVEVHGTQFSVEIVEDDARARHTEVRVREGRVLVRWGEHSRFLGAGERWSSRADAAASPAPAALSPPEPAPSQAAAGAASEDELGLDEPRKPGARAHSRARRGRSARAPTPASELAAQNQLLEAAELAQKSGLPFLALARLDALIARYPDAELAHNARVERFRVLSLAGRRSEAAAAARDYLDRYPSGFARPEAERLLADPAPASP